MTEVWTDHDFALPAGHPSTWERECKQVTVERDELRARVAELEAALRFYADVGDYKAPFTGAMGKLWLDCGDTARAALKPATDATGKPQDAQPDTAG